jgi:pilus assembly protein CpaC
MTARSRFLAAALVVAAATAPLAAQSPVQATAQQPLVAGLADDEFEDITIPVGRSRVLTTPFDIVRVAVTNPAVADATVVPPREVVLDGKGIGIISLIVWGRDQRMQYDVVVNPPPSSLQQQIRSIFPGEEIRVGVADDAIVLSGKASSADVAARAVEIATASAAKAKIVNLMDVPTAETGVQQVMLEVRFAEVERNALLEIGTNILARRTDWDLRTSTQQFPAPIIDESKPAPIQVPDYLNVFFFLKRESVLATIRALEKRGLFQILAEPNLIAYNGQEASFLAGGEFPIPIVSGIAGQVQVEFKEFGVRLKFKPTITGDVIRLRVEPEVSIIDAANGVDLAGFRIPALKTRRASTEVEVRDGQSFAIAGLLDNRAVDDHQSIPWLSKIPIIGHLFKSRIENRTRNELLVLITPHLVQPLDPSQLPPLPIIPELLMKPGGPGKKDDKPKGGGFGDALEGAAGLADAPPLGPFDAAQGRPRPSGGLR